MACQDPDCDAIRFLGKLALQGAGVDVVSIYNSHILFQIDRVDHTPSRTENISTQTERLNIEISSTEEIIRKLRALDEFNSSDIKDATAALNLARKELLKPKSNQRIERRADTLRKMTSRLKFKYFSRPLRTNQASDAADQVKVPAVVHESMAHSKTTRRDLSAATVPPKGEDYNSSVGAEGAKTRHKAPNIASSSLLAETVEPRAARQSETFTRATYKRFLREIAQSPTLSDLARAHEKAQSELLGFVQRQPEKSRTRQSLRDWQSNLLKAFDKQRSTLIKSPTETAPTPAVALSAQDRSILSSFTSNSEFHERLNSELWSDDPSPETVENARVLSEALSKLPDFIGLVYRGSEPSVPAAAYNLDIYVPGDNVVFDGFTSTSVSRKRYFDGEIVWLIGSRFGKVIAPYSDFPGQEEVLLDRGSKFLVYSHDEVHYESGVVKHLIYMEQV